MKIGINDSKGSFSDRWIEYCQKKAIDYKIVDCYKSDIIRQLSDCDALMWHISHFSAKDFLMAKQLIFSLEAGGKKVFPDYYTVWHFDDKLGQKYLLEAIGAPLVPTYLFYDKQHALKWSQNTDFPKVFKLRAGAGSQNVKLIHSKNQARRVVKRAFGRGIPVYDNFGYLREWWHKRKLGKSNITDLLKELFRFVFPAPFAKIKGREKGYVYFQDYIPDNTFDIRIIIIGDKAFGIKRMVRQNDFRASGSGMIMYEKEHFSDEMILLSFQMAKKLKSKCAAFDYVFSGDKILVTEVSFGFIKEVYDPCTGYWDDKLNYYEGKFNPYGWMVEDLINSITGQQMIKEKQ